MCCTQGFSSETQNQRTNGPVNAHLRSAAYTNKRLNIMVFNPSAGADEAHGPFSFFQNNQYSVLLPISCWLFPSNDILTVFLHSNAWATHADLAINWVKVITGS